MSQEDKKGQIIMSNILYLAQIYKKSNQRNLLNKWFQDSVKNYILESIASPLIATYMNCSSSAAVKDFILKNVDKIKPKYMGIMEQYFFQINKFNLGDRFKDKLNAILLNPIDYSIKPFIPTYNNEKTIRKQFICFLVLRYFESYEKHQFPSFYELWNFCFPEEAQIKKKLSKFDKKIEKIVKKKSQNRKINKRLSKNNDVSESLKNSSTCISILQQKNSFNQESYQNNDTQPIKERKKFANISNQFDVKYQQDNYFSQQIKNYPQKKQINNHIFEDHDDEEVEEDEELQQNTFQKVSCNKNDEILFEQNICCSQNQHQSFNNHSLYFEQDQSFYYFESNQSPLPIQQVGCSVLAEQKENINMLQNKFCQTIYK
ncbi:hypothetical protein ABPG72_020321 [Tetrahymena utriculariae]